MLSSKDMNFVGYTYKNFEIVNDYQVPGMGISLSLPLSLTYTNTNPPRVHLHTIVGMHVNKLRMYL